MNIEKKGQLQAEKRGWFEQRLGLNSFFSWFLNREVPRGVGWWYVLGSATMVVFMVLVATGIFMMINYAPSPDHAYASIQYGTTQVAFGQLIRSIHFYAASAMVILCILHLVRVYFMAAYRYPRELTWVIGAVLLLLVMGSSFTGYLLPWDQRAYWATNVASGIAGSVPLLGPLIQKLLLGGTTVGTATLTRFFTLHVGIIPALIMGLIGLHLFMVIKQGISAPPGQMKLNSIPGKSKQETYESQYKASKKGGESFFPHTLAKDTVFAILIVAAIFAISIISPHMSEAPADPTSQTYNPTPEWYFLFLFQFLKLFPGWLEPVAAVLIPGIAVVILICVPFIDRGIGRYWKQRKPAIFVGGFAVAVIVVLETMGALSAPTRPQGQENVLAIDGQKVYLDINCGYCHSINGVGGAIGPDLSNIASQLTKDQIATYLKNPDLMVANTLHPKLQFTPQELDQLTAYLETLGPPVVFSAQAPQLFADHCAICHAINGVGGSVGPDLSKEGKLRTVDFLASFITDPKSVAQGTTMPPFGTVLSQDQIKDLAAYLFSLKGPVVATTPTPTATTPPATTASPVPSATSSHTPTTTAATTSVPTSAPPTTTTAPPTTTAAAIDGAALYTANCAPCHGANRQGGLGPALTKTAMANTTVARIVSTIDRGADNMPAFSSRLSADQINAIANFVKN